MLTETDFVDDTVMGSSMPNLEQADNAQEFGIHNSIDDGGNWHSHRNDA